MKFKRSVAAAAALAAIGLALAACSSSSSSPAAVASGSTAPHSGGTVTQVVDAISPTIDPASGLITTQASLLPAIEAVYGPGLVYLNPDTGVVEMGFAQSLTTNDNGKVWTLVLHPGLKFSDGSAFNAAAVAYNIARLANPATGSAFQSAAEQLKTKVISATTLQITCTPADALLPQIMAQDFAFIASPKALAAEGENFGAHPVGPGPFTAATYVDGLSWTFDRNPYYHLFAANQPYLDHVEILLAAAPTNATTDLQTGAAQTWEPLSGQQVSMAQGAGMTVETPDQAEIATLTFNVTKPPFNNLLAREAVYDALDPKAITNVWLPGDPTATNLFSPESPFYDKKYDFPAPDSAKAQSLFNQLAAEGHPVAFSVLWPTGGTAGDVPAYIVGALSKYKNVKVTVNAVPHTLYHQDQADGGFQMASGDLPNPVPGAFELFGTGGSVNFGKWSDPVVDASLAKLQATTNVTEQKQLWGTIQQEVNTQFPFVWSWRASFGYAYNPKVVGGLDLTNYGQVAFWGPMFLKQ